MGTQISSEGLAPKARLHGVGGRTFLALYKRHSALFPSCHEVDVGSLDSATLLLTEMPMEAFPVVSMEILGDLDRTCETSPRRPYPVHDLSYVVCLRRSRLAPSSFPARPWPPFSLSGSEAVVPSAAVGLENSSSLQPRNG